MKQMMRAMAMAGLLAAAACSSEGPSQLDTLRGKTRSAAQTSNALVRAQALLDQGQPALVVGVEARGQTAPMLLLSSRAGRDTWITSDDVSIITQSGIVAGTRGLSSDLMTADVAQVAPLILSRENGRAKRFHSYLDGNNQTVFGSYVCDVSNLGPVTFILLDQSYQGVLMSEDCVGAEDRFTNQYWLQGANIVQSRQWISAGAGAVQIGVVR